ncbi:precorrin-2 C(20)-methyltransferase [Marinivivus vitaminiproducens]|nr:precorrin-2 C(20)-methyltransferase [Geminicoccaceae bacterium SCSIO 64248]
MTGRLFGVGVGPGDPELITRKAERVIREAPVVAYHAGPGRTSNARRIAAGLIRPDHIELRLVYPVTTGSPPRGESYEEALRGFYAEAEAAVASHLDAGRDVAVLAEGDPLFYGSYMHLHIRLAGRYRAEVVPGVASLAAASAALQAPIAFRDDVLTVLPGTLSEGELARRLADAGAAVVMKLGRNFAKVRRALDAAGVLDRALYIERASMAEERIVPVADVDPAEVPYFALLLVPGRLRL